MYKLIAVDLDGTLLNSYGIVTEETKQTIKQTMKKGTDVIIASGRPVDSIETIAKEIDSKNYFIAGNGALIYDMKNNKTIYEKVLDVKKILKIIDLCEKNSIFYNIYTEDVILTKALKFNVLYYYKENLKKDEENKTKIKIVENMKEYIKNSQDKKYLKVTICDESEMVFNSIIKKLKNISDIEVLEVSHMTRKTIKHGTEESKIEYFYTEIALKDVNKWTAIEYLLKRLELKKEEVIAIGDNMNDKDMIENAGVGVAMGQSTPKVIQIADYVTEDNENDGVKKAIEKYC
ncbi:MAG: HAD family phosphatase [Clostridia bacterium]|nr:HAD family phosphatase [Clostridia bacterium]